MTVVSDEALVGQTLDKRYVIHDRIARGGMASVFRATDLRLDRTVAVKVMHGGLGDPAVFTERFEHEARASAKLNHRNVVAVFDQGTDGDYTYLVMEYVPGKTLRDVMREEAPMAPSRALTFLEPMLLALGAAHEARLVHRDIKPENVLISKNGEVKVADFGLARAVSNSTTHSGGALIGTVSYLAPEVVTNRGADPRADVYACGAVLFEMLTGRKAHVAETPLQVAYLHVNEDVAKPSSLTTGIPDYVDALVARATARDRGQRSPDARALLQQVRQVRRALAAGLTTDPELAADLQPGSGPTPAQLPTMPTQVELNSMAKTAMGGSAADSVPTATVTHADPEALWPAPAAPTSSIPSFTERLVQTRQIASSDLRDAASTTTKVPTNAKNRRTSRRGAIGLVAVIIALILVTLLGWYLGEGRYSETPQLVGLDQAEATTVAEGAGFIVDIGSEEFSEDVPAGVVISTDPEASEKILPESTISLVLSKGPERYELPDIVGMSRGDATAALREANLVLGDVDERYDEEVESGLILEVPDYSPGDLLRSETAVDVVVSLGRQPIQVPSQVGVSEATATEAIRGAGFEPQITRQFSTSVSAGTVISQNPAGGTAYRGDTVTLVVSDGPEIITVPDVVGMTVDEAREAVEEAGLTFRSTIEIGGDARVRWQAPSAGNEVDPGSRVTVVLI